MGLNSAWPLLHPNPVRQLETSFIVLLSSIGVILKLLRKDININQNRHTCSLRILRRIRLGSGMWMIFPFVAPREVLEILLLQEKNTTMQDNMAVRKQETWLARHYEAQLYTSIRSDRRAVTRRLWNGRPEIQISDQSNQTMLLMVQKEVV